MESPLTNIDQALEFAILQLLSQRAPEKTICPSDAARLLAPTGWKALLQPTRTAARRLVAKGVIVITQRGKVVDPAQVRGAIRLKLR